jgi:large subunit ribosomal protein L25
MSDQATIDALPRQPRGKGGARALRREGRMPAIVYGGGDDPLSVSLDYNVLERELGRRGFFARLYDLKVNGDIIRVLPRDVQVDPVTDAPLHIDFIRYVAGATLAVSVEVRFEGQEESEGLKRGGVLNIVRHEVELLCPLEAIPEFIVADVAGSEIGDSIHISHIELPEGVTPTITDRDFTVATIAAPTIIVEPVDEEEGEEGEELEEGDEEGAEEGEAAPDAEGEES